VAACPHAAAAGADGEHPGTVPPAAVAFQGLDERLCLGAAADRDRSLRRGGDALSAAGERYGDRECVLPSDAVEA